MSYSIQWWTDWSCRTEWGTINTSTSYFIECNYMYTLREKFCSENPVLVCFCYIIQVMAVVMWTGFMTAKGELVRPIPFPKPLSGFKFYQDLIWFMYVYIFFILFATLGMAYSIDLYVKRHISVISTSDNKKFYKSNLRQ